MNTEDETNLILIVFVRPFCSEKAEDDASAGYPRHTQAEK